MKFQEHVEDYLLTIYKYQLVHGYAKTSQVARELGVKDATVTKVLKRLQQRGLVEVSKYRGAKLTDDGIKIASNVLRKHRIIEIFLYKYLGFDIYKAHELAHMMEHLPDEVIEAIYKKLGEPDTCIVGLPLEAVKASAALTLDKAVPGKCYQIICLISEFKSVIEKLKNVGCWVCSTLRVDSKGSKGLTITMDNGKKLILSLDESKSIAVKEVSCDDLNNTLIPSPTGCEGKGAEG
ncbi:MAG: metal-dependent transcriptional regulator [Desulfurococcales archaeon]|nr:metal-dependent transcriptional regulator [Desulfurococcales archaeon]